MPLNLFYTMVQKTQKWPKTQIKGGGSCLKKVGIFFFCCLLENGCNPAETSCFATLTAGVMRKKYISNEYPVRTYSVAASCFHFISFAENTSAALAPRAGISQPILLLFFFWFSGSWICLQNVALDIFLV